MPEEKISFEEAIDDSAAFSKRHLILGNGFSIALRPNIFTYSSLFEQSGILDDERLSAVFEALNSTDFEYAIRSLEQAERLIPIYVDDYERAREVMATDASRLKDILIETVARNHPDGPFDLTEEEFRSGQEFLANFNSADRGKIFTTNYDLLLYWVLMHTFEEGETSALRVDDGFGNDDDRLDAPYVVWHGETRANTPTVFYLHGALHLFDDSGKLQKFTWVRTGERLKEQARAEMDSGKYPLFVSEGTTQQKFDRVRHNAYLYQGLKVLAENAGQRRHCFFVHGHSLDENDNHIFNLIGRGKCSKLYVSVRGTLGNNDRVVSNVRRIQAMRGLRDDLEVAFYDADSAQVWTRY